MDPRPVTTEHVRLRAGELDQLVRVCGVDERGVHLTGQFGPGQAEIIFSHPRGVISLGGTLTPAPDSTLFTVTEQRRLEQRRGAFRMAVRLPAQVTRASGEIMPAHTSDLSLAGVRLVGVSDLEPDEQVLVEVTLDDECTLQVPGRVVRRDGEDRAVAFTDLARGPEGRLSRFLFAQQRRAVRAA